MSSLRGRLFAILVLATSVIWLSAVVWVYFSTQSELEHVLDTRLQEAARMVDSLVASSDLTASQAADAAAGTLNPAVSYEHQLSCQVWSLDGKLIARSSGAPDQQLTETRSGFSDRMVGGEPWRVYSIDNAKTGIRVLVGDRLGLRDRLVGDLVKGVLAPIALIVPVLALLIWGSLGRGLRPLLGMASDLEGRTAEDMRPLVTNGLPRELRPLAQSINAMFERVGAARRHERDVTAFAAHELRTPLAGLKAQAQIALASPNETVRQNALGHILTSVDRSSRLVRQLLALASLEALDAPAKREAIDLGGLLSEITETGSREPGGVATSIDAALFGRTVHTNRDILTVALRNLHENALAHSPAGGTISWSAASGGNGVMVTDEGPGIPEDEIELVAQRFYRGRHKAKAGTGLGLTIVKTAAEKLNASFSLQNRPNGQGLAVSFELPQMGSAPSSPGPKQTLS